MEANVTFSFSKIGSIGLKVLIHIKDETFKLFSITVHIEGFGSRILNLLKILQAWFGDWFPLHS